MSVFSPCRNFSEMACKAVEYAEQDLTGVLNGLSALSLATGPHRRRDRHAAAPAHVLVVDGNMREDALVDLARSVDEVCSVLCLCVVVGEKGFVAGCLGWTLVDILVVFCTGLF